MPEPTARDWVNEPWDWARAQARQIAAGLVSRVVVFREVCLCGTDCDAAFRADYWLMAPRRARASIEDHLTPALWDHA